MEWKEVTLGEISSKIGDGLHGTPKYDDEGPYYFINGNNLNCGKIIIKDDTKRVGKDEFVKNQKELNEQTILVSINGTIGNVAKYNNEPCILGKSACYINVIKEVDKEFIYYVLTSANFKRNITNEATGTTIKNVSLKQMREYKFNIPCNIADQCRIASILSSLDRKIELNNKINADLEEMAQAIFKNWFVDFEPFKDDKFVDSELGMIPEGWKVGKITDIGCLITDYVSNGSFASLKQNVHLYETKEYAQFIRNTDLKTNTFSVYVDKHSYDFLSKSTLYGNEIIISNVGDVGSVHLCPKLDIPMTLGNNIIMLRPNEKEYNYFLYLWFKYFSGQGLIQGIKGGSAQPKFNKTDFKNLPLLIPSFEIIEKSYWIFESMFSILSSNVKESSRLSTLRDTLLPRLMSGELEVPE